LGAEPIDFAASDGAPLRGALFPIAGPRASVVLLGGRCEFIEKYFEVVRDLQRRGFAVAAMDWRGQGLSARSPAARGLGHIEDFGLYRSDLAEFVRRQVMPRLPGPYLLMTHSMGGVPALQLLADGDDAFRAAVLCAPMTQLFASPLRRAAARALAAAATRLGWSARAVAGVKEHSLAFEGNILTSDPVRHARFRDLQLTAPEAAIGAPTYGWLRAALAAIDDLHRPGRFSALRTPVLIISAANDRLVASPDHAVLARASPLIECATVDGALHEILMERDDIRDVYWRLFDAFVGAQLSAAARPAAEMTQP
jgi:lysophospholipase